MALSRKALALLGTAVIVAACTSAGASPSPGGTTPPSSPGGGEASAPASADTGCGVTVNANGGLDPLPDGFPDQPITIISIDDPGSPDSIYALTLKSVIEDHRLTDQRIIVEDRPDFGTYGTWEGLEYINNDPAGKEGYILAIATIPGAVFDLLGTDVVAKLGADLNKLNILKSTEYVPYVMTSRKNAPWGNDVGAMIKYAQEHPYELKYISRGPGSGLDVAFKHYSQVAARVAGIAGDGIPVTEIVGGSHAEINAVLGAGEGDIAMTLSDVAKQFYDDGRVEVLTFSGNAPAPEPFDVPTMKEYFGDALPTDPWGQNRSLFGATDMPQCHFEWLVKLIELAVATPEFQEQRLRVPGLTLQDLSREEVLELGRTAYELSCPILKAADLIDPTVTPPC